VATRRDTAARAPGVAAILSPERLPELLGQADFVVLTVPLTDATHRLIGEPELRAMKPTAHLINVSRGAVVDEGALVRALEGGWIAGASLDVFEREPLEADSPLWTLPNLVVTPHYSGGGPRQREEAADEIARNLRRLLRGQPLVYQVNRADIPTR
jgi:phosphoglycerate dehydrogenase-like enzyme